MLFRSGGEKLLQDIVLVQLGADILESNIAEPSQANLSERVIDDYIVQKEYGTNLLCQMIDRLGGARPSYNGARRLDTEPSRFLGLLRLGGCTL